MLSSNIPLPLGVTIGVTCQPNMEVTPKLTKSPHFELETTKDLFIKAEHDWDKFNKCANSHDLFNFVCTINSMFDWADKELQKTPQRVPTNKPDDSCTLDVIRRLCNRAKHYGITQQSLDTGVTPKGYSVGDFGKGAYGSGAPTYTVQLNKKDVLVKNICEDALNIWRSFLKTEGLL